ncbi:MAG: hypothetical protein J7J99_06930 [Thermoprotei archaeon]|nr:hypothetical protein [Thermoprotei archaeon]
MSVKDVVKVLSEEIRKAAEEEARKVIENAKREVEIIIENAKRRAEELRRQKIAQVTKEIRQKLLKEYAQIKIELKKEYLLKKNEIFNNILRELREKLQKRSLERDEVYVKGLRNLIEEALLNVDSDDVVLYVLPKDQEIVREMLPNIIKEVEKKKRRKIRIKIADLKGNYIGGIIVQSVDGREYYNNTLDSRVRLIEEELFKIVISIVQKK